MADLVNKLQELKSLPEEAHWFCPHGFEDDRNATEVEKEQKVSQALENGKSERSEASYQRNQLALDALQILAFDGDDAKKWQTWLRERLQAQLTSCDVCIRSYHYGKRQMKQKLEELFDEDEVANFLGVIDDLDINRIKEGLDCAAKDLLDTPPAQRGIASLNSTGLYAIFETLSCKAFYTDEQLLSDHFDQPFRLIQSNKKLKMNDLTPATTAFLFGSNEYRQAWAFMIWSRLKSNINPEDFDFALKDPLYNAMKKVQPSFAEPEQVSSYWSAMKVVLGKIEKSLITHSLRALDIDVCKLALEHIQLDFKNYEDLLNCIQLLLMKAPSDFWDAMGAIPPVTIIELVYNSHAVEKSLRLNSNTPFSGLERAETFFDWIWPFIASVKASNQAPICRCLANQMLVHFQSDTYSAAARDECLKIGFKAILVTLRNMSHEISNGRNIGGAIVSEVLDVVYHHTDMLISQVKGLNLQTDLTEVQKLCLELIQHFLALDCSSLSRERNILATNGRWERIEATQFYEAWMKLAAIINPTNVALANSFLLGCRDIIGLDLFTTKQKSGLSADCKKFEAHIIRLWDVIRDVLDKLNDFHLDDLLMFMKRRSWASGLIAQLFASDLQIHQSTVELIKLMSLQTGRKESLHHLLKISYSPLVSAFSIAIRRVASRKAYPPCPRILRLSGDLIDIMCDSQTGLFRTRSLDPDEGSVTEFLWVSIWEALAVIFETTEVWSNNGYPKEELMNFCRDTMQFADRLFENYGIFASALENALGSSENVQQRLLNHSKPTMKGMVKWLRLRDEYLSSKSVSLISKLLVRLRDSSIELPIDTLKYIEGVLKGEIRAKLSDQQLTELERAFEAHIERSAIAKTVFAYIFDKDASSDDVEKTNDSIDKALELQGRIDFNKWKSKAENSKFSASKDSSIEPKKASTQVIKENLLTDIKYKETAEEYKARIERKNSIKSVITAKRTSKAAVSVNPSEFKRQRELEKEAKKKRDAAAIAAAKKHLPLRATSGQAREAGSGLAGLGVAGKDHASKGTGMMVSSEEESEEDADNALDRELFGLTKGSKQNDRKPSGGNQSMGTLRSLPLQPVKKRRLVRSFRDMRARLAPDLSTLHTLILNWDYFHDGDYPPNSSLESYNKVSDKFRTPLDYQRTFEPLLTLEAWQGFLKAREEGNSKPFEIKIVSRSSVDAFVEISTSMDQAENKDLMLSEGDICLLAEAKNPATSQGEPHCLARVWRVTRKKSRFEILYRTVPGNPLVSALVPQGTVYGIKVQSITPLEREYGALLGLQYYDLCEEIIKAKPSPLLKYTDTQVEPVIGNYNLNTAQAKAVKSAIDNDAFTLIQGPPGSGKTKTIVAIVGALLTGSVSNKGVAISRSSNPLGIAAAPLDDSGSAPKKMLVCAPSNAAVDELVMRFKDGIKTLNGESKKISVVRLGRSDAINTNVLDVTLDELVKVRTGNDSANAGRQKDDTQKLMKEHQKVSEDLREARSTLEKSEPSKGEHAGLKDKFETLRRRKTQLSAQIDIARDNESITSRQNEMNRKRAQQAIIDGAHIICATLSGSGHDMFQSLNVEFETVVVDEAAQCVEMSALIPLKYGCAKCILVGDPKQLPPTVFSKEAARFQYEQSLFVRMQANHPNDVHLLDTQYRMHPQISMFPSKAFYDSRLLDGENMAVLRKRPWHHEPLLGPYQFFDVQGQHQAAPKGHSLVNIAEVKVALEIYEILITRFNEYDFKGRIGIITPYKSQLRELKEKFVRKFGRGILEGVEFNTTDAFQGRESEVIIFSCVRASPAGGIGFLQDVRRMNVGLTRAKSSLWVLGNSESLMRGEFWQKLVVDSRQRKCYIQGDIIAMLRTRLGTQAVNNETGFSTNGLGESGAIKYDTHKGSGSAVDKSFLSSSGLGAHTSGRVAKLSDHAPNQFRNDYDIHIYNRKRKVSVSDEDVEMSDVMTAAPTPEANDHEASSATSSRVVSEKSTPRTDPDIPISLNKPSPKSGVSTNANIVPGDKVAHNGTPRPRIPPNKKKKPVNALIQPNRPRKPQR